MRVLRVLGFVVLLAALGAVGGGWWAWRTLHRPLPHDGVSIEIAQGTSAGAILRDLERHGLVADALLARLYLVHILGDPSLKAGEYRFDEPASSVRVLDKLIRGEVVLHQVTVIEGLTLPETAEALATAGFGDRERFLAAMNDPSPIADLDPEAESLEGYLHPDTYAFSREVTEGEIVATLVRTFRERFETRIVPLLEDPAGRIRLARPAGSTGSGRVREGSAGSEEPPPDEPRVPPEVAAGRRLELTPGELVTLASIVEKEARLDEERPLIAAVYVNRLLAGMGLYADPTVIYALQRRGTWDGNLRREDLQLDSPYNTYRYGGLPPGPIASPGLESLRAAADPAAADFLYFVSRNDGSHVFARTLAEHNRNVREWQKRYWRERWARERREAGDGDGG
ncbi:MAG: endolytic transglycosylase MltG [Acidobacteriota bacterium]|jgi:UPF0755 protein